MLVLCKFKCMYINPAFCRVKATGGTQIDSSTSAFRRTSEIQMPSLVSVLMCRHFSVPVTSFDYQLRNTWCAGITWYFYTCCILGNCEHLFQSESSCQIFLSLQCMVDFPQSKIFLFCLRWPKHGDFLVISPPKSVPQTSRARVYHYFPTTMWAVCFHSYFQSAAAVPIAMGKGIQFSAWPLGNPYLKLFSRVSIPELLLLLPTKNLLWSQMCRCFHFNVYFEGHLLLHFHYPLGFCISWTQYSPSYSDQAPNGVLGFSWWKGEQLHTFSCSVYTVLWSLAYQHSNYKANIKWYQTYLILLNFLAVPRLSETLAAKAQGSSFAVSLESAPRLWSRHAKFHMVVCFLLTAVVWTLCSISPDSPRPSSAFSLTSTICKSFLCPTKGLTFSCQQTFFNLSLSQQTLLNPFANVLALKAVVCCYLPILCSPIPVLGAALFAPSSSSPFFSLCTKFFRTPAPPSLSKFLILLLSSSMFLWAYGHTGRFCRGIRPGYRRKMGNVWAQPFSGCGGGIPTVPAWGPGSPSLWWHKV